MRRAGRGWCFLFMWGINCRSCGPGQFKGIYGWGVGWGVCGGGGGGRIRRVGSALMMDQNGPLCRQRAQKPVPPLQPQGGAHSPQERKPHRAERALQLWQRGDLLANVMSSGIYLALEAKKMRGIILRVPARVSLLANMGDKLERKSQCCSAQA
jgi:hypothetical protein